MSDPERALGEYQDASLDDPTVSSIIEKMFGDNSEYESESLGGCSLAPHSVLAVQNNCKKFGLSIEDIYSINSHGLRSDEFSKRHSGKHIVFAGCSFTFGDGLPLEYTWPHKVYTEIKKRERVSGYYNISQSGASGNWILIQALKYVRDYGCPDVMFINLPEVTRELGYQENSELSQEVTQNLYSILQGLVTLSGGRVIAFSWDEHVNNSFKGKDFYRYSSQKDKMPHMFLFSQGYKPTGTFIDNFLMTAMDDAHPGIAEHDFYSNFAYHLYSKNSAR